MPAYCVVISCSSPCSMQIHFPEVIQISPFDMSCAQAHWVGSKPIRRVTQLNLHKPTMAIGYSMRTLADPELQKRGAKFLPKFFRDLFLGVSRKNVSIFPFFSHRLFSCFNM